MFTRLLFSSLMRWIFAVPFFIGSFGGGGDEDEAVVVAKVFKTAALLFSQQKPSKPPLLRSSPPRAHPWRRSRSSRRRPKKLKTAEEEEVVPAALACLPLIDETEPEEDVAVAVVVAKTAAEARCMFKNDMILDAYQKRENALFFEGSFFQFLPHTLHAKTTNRRR